MQSGSCCDLISEPRGLEQIPQEIFVLILQRFSQLTVISSDVMSLEVSSLHGTNVYRKEEREHP